MNENMKVGDVVQLKSGGPKMTVDSLEDRDGYPSVHCVWFVDNGLKQGIFKPSTLKKSSVGDLVLVWSNDGWDGIYVDGKLVNEADGITMEQALDTLGIEYTQRHADENVLEDMGRLPENLVDLKDDPEDD